MHRRLATTFAVLIPLCAIAVSAVAQDRMPPIAPDKYSDAQKKAAEEFAGGRGYDVRGPFVPLIRSPEVMLRAKAMGDHLRFKSTLAPRLSEMIILITAREWTQQFEWSVHSAIALKAGVSPETVKALAEGRRPAGLFPARFGNDSFEPHHAAAQATGKPCLVLSLPGIALDVDTPADVRALAAAPGETRAQRLVRQWQLTDLPLAANE